MAIQPIDLQTIYTQLDKVGKTQSDLKEGVALQQALQGAQIQKKIDERVRSVNETPESGEGPERITDKSYKRRRQKSAAGKNGVPSDESSESEEESEVVRDPNLGRNVDLSG